MLRISAFFDVTEKIAIVVGTLFWISGGNYKLDEKFIFHIIHFLLLGFIVLSFMRKTEEVK
jgi:hypothetical protein